MEEIGYPREARERAGLGKLSWLLHLYAASAIAPAVCIFLKAAWFLSQNGRWPRYWRDDPGLLPEDLVYRAVDWAFFISWYGLPVHLAFTGAAVTTYLVTKKPVWRNLLLICAASWVGLIAFFVLDPGKLVTWIID